LSKFVSTESSTQPIVLGKEPVPKPEIVRGEISTALLPSDIIHGGDIINGGFETVTFVTRSACEKYRLTYHRAQVLAFAPEFRQIKAMIHPSTVVTWEEVAH
jgi:hypothetical protein